MIRLKRQAEPVEQQKRLQPGRGPAALAARYGTNNAQGGVLGNKYNQKITGIRWGSFPQAISSISNILAFDSAHTPLHNSTPH
jgi:hypothetical protein